MKKCLFAGALSICILLLSGCSLITKQANAKLTPILFDSPNSIYSCTIDGQQYFSTSGNTNDKNLEKKFAVYYEDDELRNEAYTVKGYDNKDFILIKTFLFMENTSDIYIKDGVEQIPWEFARWSMPYGVKALQYDGKDYTCFSNIPADFLIGEEIGKAVEKVCHKTSLPNEPNPVPTPLYDRESTIYSIPGKAKEEWIVVKPPGTGPYTVYWTEDGGIESVPWSYLQMQRAYSIYFDRDNKIVETPPDTANSIPE